MLNKTLISILFSFSLFSFAQAQDNYTNYLNSNYNYLMSGFDFISKDDGSDVFIFIRSEFLSEAPTSGVTLQEKDESPKEKIKETSDENFNNENPEEGNISAIVFQVGIFLLIALTFGTMAFFLIKYMRRNK